MKRLGKYTGRIYDESDELPEECCIWLTDDEAADEEYLRVRRTLNTIDCKYCLACPIAMKGN